jgi:hypothetical protein
MTTAYFGNEAQRTLLQRGRDLHELTASDPRFTYYGRTVGLRGSEDGPLEHLIALARLQGNSNYSDLAMSEAEDMADDLTARGMAPVIYARWEGGEDTLAKALEIGADTSLGRHLTIQRLTEDTPEDLIAAFAETALTCGVLPPATAALSGRIRPAVTLFAATAKGEVASCASTCAFLSDAHADARRICWWGMLSTHPDHRGARLSLILGARVIRQMHESHGFSRFFTGVVPGNAASEAVCSHLALAPTGRAILGVADPSAVPGGRMTK